MSGFRLDQVPMQPLELPGLTLSPVAIDMGTAQFDLVLHLTDLGKEVVGTLQYKKDLFDAATMERFFRHFQTILQVAVERPEVRLSELNNHLAEADRELWSEKEKDAAIVSSMK